MDNISKNASTALPKTGLIFSGYKYASAKKTGQQG
jgi:hypothetical protein